MIATGRGCGHQTLMFSCLEAGTKTIIGDRAFQVAGPPSTYSWNILLVTIRETKTLPAFKKQLKLYLIGNLEH